MAKKRSFMKVINWFETVSEKIFQIFAKSFCDAFFDRFWPK